MNDIASWSQSNVGFYVDRHYDADTSRWVLEPGPIKLASYHADILRYCFTPDESGRLPYDVIGWCEPAKSGKSAIAGLVAKYMALHGEQNSTIVMASNKQRQAASIMFKSLTDSIGYNPHLPNIEPGKYEVGFRNGNRVVAIPSNSRGEAGARFSLAAFDELWGYIHSDAERLWAAFKVDPTRLNSVKLAVGFAGYVGESTLWLDVLNTGLGGSPVPELAHITNADGEPACWRNGRHFTFWSHVCRQPWQTDAWIQSQRKSLRAPEFARMILTQFAEGIGNFCDAEDWEALIDPNLQPLEPGDRQHPLYIGLDLALSPKGDDCALIATYADGQGRVATAFHKLWKGKDRRQRLKLGQTVKPYLLWARDNFRVAAICFDPWQAQHLMDELRHEGLVCVEIPQTRASRGPRDTRLYEMVSNRQLRLYDDPDLRTATAGANAQELGDGRIFLKKAGSKARIDLLVALSNCASEAYHRPTAKAVNLAAAIEEHRAKREREMTQPPPGPGIVTLRYTGDRTHLKRINKRLHTIRRGFEIRTSVAQAKAVKSFEPDAFSIEGTG